MAERVIKYQTQDGEQLLDPQIQGTDGKSSDEIRDTVNALRNGGAGGAEAIDVARKTKIAEGGMNPGDGRNVAMDIAKCLRDALREHGDEMKAVYLSNSTNEGVTIKVQYMPSEEGQADEDEFVFRWNDGKVRLDNIANPIELCQLQKQSGTATVQKDLVKANLLKFLQSHDKVGDEEDNSQPVDPNALPDGPVAEENLWESEECQNAFCDAVAMYRQAKSKESIKNLFRAARPYQKGNTIQEKLKGAVEWYNLYKENPPKNTKEQVFLEDDNLEEGYVPGVITALQKISEGLDILKTYINRTEDTHLGAYYRELESKYESLFDFCRRQIGGLHGFDDKLSEVWDVNDPIANGEDSNPSNFDFNQKWEDYDDEPVVHEGDEWGPEVGDDVDYEGGHYKLYGYCGHEVVLQNVDDERDFKVVKPEQAGIGAPEKSLEETNWVDPDELPDSQMNEYWTSADDRAEQYYNRLAQEDLKIFKKWATENAGLGNTQDGHVKIGDVTFSWEKCPRGGGWILKADNLDLKFDGGRSIAVQDPEVDGLIDNLR